MKRGKPIVKGKKAIKILAIDPASILGWALSRTTYGTWDLKTRKDESMGMKLIRLNAKLNEIHSGYPLDLVVYERPGGMHTNPIIHQSKLIGKIEEWCELNKVEYRGYSSKEIKKFATGKGNAGKPLMISAACLKLGYPGTDDNEADALWLLKLAESEY